MYCPKDLKGCCDDLCYGGGCIEGAGPMLNACADCGKPVICEDGEDSGFMICDACYDAQDENDDAQTVRLDNAMRLEDFK